VSIRVRFAPSPTGQLHVGGARTALFNYLFAKKNKADFILRIEDTDQDRHQEASLSSIMDNLKWLGLEWDEGPSLHKEKNLGPYAPYRQKDRLPIYKKQALKLVEESKAYYCFMNPEEEAKKKEQALKENKAWRVSSPYRDLDLTLALKKIKNGEKHCIRFKTAKTNKPYVIKDLVRGDVLFPPDSLGDFIILRTEGFPVYNFSCAVDDALMKISHVFRAEEHLPNTLKQKLIQEALGFKPPQTGHLSIILGKDKKKLSKRSGAESIDYYQKEGYLASALINFLSLLGWNPKTEKEFFSKKELIQNFNLEGLNSSSGIFDEDKLLLLNRQHLKSLSNEQLFEKIKNYFITKNGDNSEADFKKWEEVIPVVRSNFKTLKQAITVINIFCDSHFKLQKSAKALLNQAQGKIVIEKWISFLRTQKYDHLEFQSFKSFQNKTQNEEQIKGKDFFYPLRYALMGQTEGLEIKILIQNLTVKQMLNRALKTLDQMK